MIKRKDNQRGASLVEFALAFPIVIVLTFGIVNLGQMWFSRLLIRQAHFKAVRDGALAGASCKTVAANKLRTYLQTARISFDNTGVIASGRVQSAGTVYAPKVTGYRLRARVQIKCPACGLVPALARSFVYDSELFYPLPIGDNSCPT